MDKLKEQRYRGLVIAGIAGIVAFIAFFLPYLTYSQIISLNGSQAAGYNGLVWIELLIAIVAIVIPALLIYRNNPLGSATTPVEKQIRWGVYGLLGVGALGVLAQIIFAITVNSFTVLGVPITSLGVGYGFGFWLYLLAAIAIIVGGVMAYRTMPALIAGQSWQYPSSTQYPPYGQQYPSSTQYPPYQSGDQNPYPSYPAQQYPTADQQQYQPTELKQPYPPTGPQQQYQPTEYQQPPYQQQQQYPPQQYPPQQYPPSQ